MTPPRAGMWEKGGKCTNAANRTMSHIRAGDRNVRYNAHRFFENSTSIAGQFDCSHGNYGLIRTVSSFHSFEKSIKFTDAASNARERLIQRSAASFSGAFRLCGPC